MSWGENFSLQLITNVVFDCTMLMGRFPLCAEHSGIVASLVEYEVYEQIRFRPDRCLQNMSTFHYSADFAEGRQDWARTSVCIAQVWGWSCCVCSKCDWHSMLVWNDGEGKTSRVFFVFATGTSQDVIALEKQFEEISVFEPDTHTLPHTHRTRPRTLL